MQKAKTIIISLTLLALINVGGFERDFTVGYLTGSMRKEGDRGYPRPGLTISGAISLAVEEINQQEPLIDGSKVNFIVAETYGEESESILQTALLWSRNVSAYIGPQETCVHEARMAASFQLPMISYFCAHPETSNKDLFPTFSRTRPPDTQISKSVASLLLAFGWRKVALLFSKTRDKGFQNVAETIIRQLEEVRIEVSHVASWPETYHYGYEENPFDQLVEDSYKDIRIYLILGFYFEHIGLMMSLQAKGLLNSGDYFVVGIDIEQYDRDLPKRYLKGLLRDEIEEKAKDAFRSYMGVVGSSPIGFEDFTVKVNRYMQLPPFNFPNPVGRLGGLKKVPAEGAYLYDAVKLYARAVNTSLKMTQNPRDGNTVSHHIRGTTYRSAMGYMVSIDENGDAGGNYTVISLRALHPTGAPPDYAIIPVGCFHPVDNASALPELYLWERLDWVGGKPPVDEPTCGFHNEKCILWKIATGITGGVICGLFLVAFAVYKNWSYEQELDSLLWKIEFKDMQVIENQFTCPSPTANNTCQGTTTKPLRSIHPVMRTSQASLSSNPESDIRHSIIYTKIAHYKGRICAIKRLKKKSVDVTRSIKKELKAMRDLRHDNLSAFVGACVEPPNLYIVFEYCGRGSLRDILENEDVMLDNMFVASLVADIIRGVVFLHDSQIRSHGNLKSSNCLVDSRWVLKLSGFGLHEFKAGSEADAENMDFEKQCEKLLWKAPELLRDPEAPPWGTKKGDSYSFGILLYELVGRQGPYGNTDLSPSEIIKRVMQRCGANELPFRPKLEALENVFDCVRNCLKECWQEDPEFRPDFKSIREKLRPMRKGMKPNIFDNMLAMMEKYANNLEVLVDERTYQLIEEKKKTDALLYEMLPRSVADKLKQGYKVEAESFDSVTIYFSDIVGFTKMSAESSPLQVVDFLNDLYTCFDSIIENHDVYKVETIGDAYMVVSGLPVRNGDRHAGEVASMALRLVDAVQTFQVRHRAGEKLMLRIGIHTGPVCAGVVGLKMPRYCLFGDTVNTASRMESTGLPLKIHCSLACKEVLDKIGGYILQERGFIAMKGKGDMMTFWLVEEIERRRIGKSSSQKDLTSDPFTPGGALRSSLKKHAKNVFQFNSSNKSAKHKKSLPASIKNRSMDNSPTNSFEAKRLRFADNEKDKDPLLPCHRHRSSDPEPILEQLTGEGKRRSCPCLVCKDVEEACPHSSVVDFTNRLSDIANTPPDYSYIGDQELTSRGSLDADLDEEVLSMDDKKNARWESEPFLAFRSFN